MGDTFPTRKNLNGLVDVLERVHRGEGPYLATAIEITGRNQPPAQSPLEQFEIVPWIPMKLGYFSLSFKNPSFFMVKAKSFRLIKSSRDQQTKHEIQVSGALTLSSELC